MKGKWFFKLLFFIFLFNEKNIEEYLTDYQENQNHSGKKSDRSWAELDFKVQALFLSLVEYYLWTKKRCEESHSFGLHTPCSVRIGKLEIVPL